MESAMTMTTIEGLAAAPERRCAPVGQRLRPLRDWFIAQCWQRYQERRMLRAVYELGHDGIVADVQAARAAGVL
jgi:hypothetical protein